MAKISDGLGGSFAAALAMIARDWASPTPDASTIRVVHLAAGIFRVSNRASLAAPNSTPRTNARLIRLLAARITLPYRMGTPVPRADWISSASAAQGEIAAITKLWNRRFRRNTEATAQADAG